MTFTVLLIVYYVFGILLYDCIPQIQFIDEVFPFILLGYALFLRKGRPSKPFIIFSAIAAAYLAYSFIIHSNTPKAIIFDFIVQIKPFVTLLSVLMIAPRFTRKEMAAVRYTMLAGAALIFVIGLTRVGEEEVLTNAGEILTGARFSFAALYSGIAYMIFSDGSRKSMLISLAITLPGFMAPVSKYLAGLALLIVLFLFTFPSLKRFRIAIAVVSAGIFAVLVYLTLDDFSLYFSSDDAARAAMYLTSFLVLRDYFPLGSGLASFGTSASANSYSAIYYKYGIDNVWGLSENDVSQGISYISDTGVVTLAQFGVLGLCLYLFSGILVLRESRKKNSPGFHMLVVFILLDIIIESVADSTLIGNRGVFLVILLGLLVADRNKKMHYEENEA